MITLEEEGDQDTMTTMNEVMVDCHPEIEKIEIDHRGLNVIPEKIHLGIHHQTIVIDHNNRAVIEIGGVDMTTLKIHQAEMKIDNTTEIII